MDQQGQDPPASIGTVRIDPEAEPKPSPAASAAGTLPPVKPAVSGLQEEQFFADSNRHALNVLKHKSGWLGVLFGTSSEAPTNIAGFLIICSLIVIVGCTFVPATAAIDETRKWAFGLVTLIIGYLFGSGSKKE